MYKDIWLYIIKIAAFLMFETCTIIIIDWNIQTKLVCICYERLTSK